MSLADKLTRPIVADDAELSAFLADLQGNILKGHGRDHTVNCFLRFDGEPAEAGTALAALAVDGTITSAGAQFANTETLKAGGRRDVPVAFLFLTHSGLAKLGFGTEADSLGDPFRQGMKARAARLNDTPNDWEPGLSDGIDAMLLVARDAPDWVDNAKKYSEAWAIRSADKLMARLTPHGITEQYRQIGRARRNAAGRGIEQFGYVDGRSQPLLTQAEVDDEPRRNGSLFTWKPDFSPAETVLVADPMGGHGEASFGSFFVFRKLEQDVKAFKIDELALADKLGLTGEDRERAGAMVVGRFEDGTPLVLSTKATGGDVANDFTYDRDPDGDRCPFEAHIRKTNPRGESPAQGAPTTVDEERSRIMARRGITYGDRTDDPNDGEIDNKPETGNGLLFMAYQADLARQFEFTQASWANEPNFVKGATGIDPVIGQGSRADYRWPAERDKPARKEAGFTQHVMMKGGAYFFAPSISAIQSFGGDAMLVAEERELETHPGE